MELENNQMSEKVTCPNSQLSWQFSLLAFLMVFVFILARGAYYTSLQTSGVANFFMQIGVAISVIGSITGFFLGFTALFQIVSKKFRQKGIGRAIVGVLLPILSAGFVMPTMGVPDKYIYVPLIESRVAEFLNEQTNDSVSGLHARGIVYSCYYFKLEKHYNEDPVFVKLICELKGESQNSELPDNFEVYIYKGLEKVECKVVDSAEQ